MSENGLIWGTYMHGFFDAMPPAVVIDRLRVRRALCPLGKIVVAYNLEPALDRLADIVRGGLRIKDITGSWV